MLRKFSGGGQCKLIHAFFFKSKGKQESASGIGCIFLKRNCGICGDIELFHISGNSAGQVFWTIGLFYWPERTHETLQCRRGEKESADICSISDEFPSGKGAICK